ncbi:MAG: glycoside hydrolase family 9 protein [Bacteroidales bacterium]
MGNLIRPLIWFPRGLHLFLSLCLVPASMQGIAQPPVEIRVNLVGYRPEAPKKALILSRVELNRPDLVLRNSDGETLAIFPALVREESWDPFPHTYSVDFSAFETEGHYHFTLLCREPDVGETRSEPFRIATYPRWQEDVVAFIRSQRCGFNPYLGVHCHSLDGLSFFGIRPDSSRIDATGGWHDAGDQLKYLITGSNTAARLLMAHEMDPVGFPDAVDALGRPGSNGLPDVLDEARWGLEWILKLHPGPGELYHQVADDRDHRGFKLPNDDNADYGWGANSYRPVYFATGRPQGLTRYQSQATGIANLAGRSAASLALGYLAFSARNDDASFADSCLIAALDLYEMGRRTEGYQQGNSYGAPYRYEENTWADDMEWAAALLFRITGEKHFLREARHYARIIGDWSWMERDTARHYEMYPFVNMGHYALWQVGTKKDRRQMAGYYAHNLDRVAKRAATNPYGVGHLFIWCSNNLAAAVATQAMLYEKMTGSDTYATLLQDHVNWLLGLNPWGTSMITGLPEGADHPVDVHMPFWRLKGESIPGSLVDGPIWTSIHEGMLGIQLSGPDEYAHLQPSRIVYVDDWMDYSTNEPTLDGSAELLPVLTYLSAKNRQIVCDSHGLQIRSDTTAPVVYLCFTGHDLDEGFPHVRRVLQETGIPASFFLTGDFIRSHRELVRDLHAEGHFVGGHSDKHLLYCSWEDRNRLLCTPEEIRRDIMDNLTELQSLGIAPTHFMPPFEWGNGRVVSIAAGLGQTTVNFSPGIRTNADYTTPDMPNYRSSEAMMTDLYVQGRQGRLNGAHVLLHPGTSLGRSDKLYLHLEEMVNTLKGMGYDFGRF